jgi:glycosyltransferase involved in cell wall biosynthesis
VRETVPSPNARDLDLGLVCLGGLGGSTTVAAELASGLARAGARVTLVAGRFPERLHLLGWTAGDRAPVQMTSAKPAAGQLRVHVAAPGAATREVLAEAHRERPFSLLHAHYAFPCGEDVAAVAARFERPWVLGLHGTDVARSADEASCARSLTALCANAAAVTCPSAWLGAEVRAVGLFEPQIIPNFIDFEPWKAAAPRARQSPPIWLYAGRLESWKGPDIAICAAAAALRQGFGAQLELVGDGTLLGPLRAAVQARALGERVHFERAAALDPARLGRVSALLVPSRREAFGMVALEAMACGVPVVAHAVGGLVELLGPGDDTRAAGRLVDFGSHSDGAPSEVERAGERLAAAAIALEGDAGARRTLLAAARERISGRYDLAAGLQRHLALYGRVLARSARG